MKMIIRGISLACFLCIFLIPKNVEANAETLPGWLEGSSGYARGLDEHLATNKPMIVYFYTSWCGYCKAFEKKVVTKEPVIKHLDSFIKVRINPEASSANSRLAKKYRASSWPGIFVDLPVSDEGEIDQIRVKVKNPGTVKEFRSSLRSIVNLGGESEAIDHSKPLEAKMEIRSKGSSNAKKKIFESKEPSKILILKNGKTIYGNVLSQDDQKIVFDEKEIGEITFLLSEIEEVADF